MAVNIPVTILGNFAAATVEQLPGMLNQALGSLEDQINGSLQDISSIPGSITAAQHGDQPGGALHAEASETTDGFMSAADKIKLDNYLGDTTAAGPATTTQYPNDGNWGFHTDTAGSTYSLAKNKGGTIYLVALTS